VPTNKQRRESARRHLERQLQRRQEREARQKKITLYASIGGTIVLIAAIVLTLVLLNSGSDKKKSTAAASSSPTTTASPSATSASPKSKVSHTPLPSRAPSKAAAVRDMITSGPCGYKQTAAAVKANPNLFNVGIPPDPKPTPTKDHTVVFETNRGNITAVLDGTSAPCNVQSLVYLVQKHFFDNTACPRSVNSGIFVVQCGDPSATTSGGPSYTVKDENLTKASYPAGAIAMANSGANTNGSQFFFITKDSNGALGKNYTVVGHITKGLNIVQDVAQGGDDGSNQAGGGRPNLDLIFKKVVLAK
jgi:peptidyl-prolyl cis-trans isomerase B (cyclophilin B)